VTQGGRKLNAARGEQCNQLTCCAGGSSGQILRREGKSGTWIEPCHPQTTPGSRTKKINFFIQIIYFVTHFAACGTLPPRAATPLPPPSTPSAMPLVQHTQS